MESPAITSFLVPQAGVQGLLNQMATRILIANGCDPWGRSKEEGVEAARECQVLSDAKKVIVSLRRPRVH